MKVTIKARLITMQLERSFELQQPSSAGDVLALLSEELKGRPDPSHIILTMNGKRIGASQKLSEGCVIEAFEILGGG